jgi:hypothetical protein
MAKYDEWCAMPSLSLNLIIPTRCLSVAVQINSVFCAIDSFVSRGGYDIRGVDHIIREDVMNAQ